MTKQDDPYLTLENLIKRLELLERLKHEMNFPDQTFLNIFGVTGQKQLNNEIIELKKQISTLLEQT